MSVKRPEYMLWFVPRDEETAAYRRQIEALATRLGTPTFTPHVTIGLLGNLSLPEIRWRTRALASEFAPVPIELTHVAWGLPSISVFFSRGRLRKPYWISMRASSASLPAM